MSIDTLSDVLQQVRLHGVVYFDLDVHAPWATEAPPSHVIASRVLPGAEHVMEYHAVLDGHCWAGLIGAPPVRLDAGDIIVFVQGDAHVVSSEPGMLAPPDLSSYRRYERDQLPLPIHTARRDTPRTRLFSGFLGCDAHPFNPLLATLPNVLHLRRTADSDACMLSQLLRFMTQETQRRHTGGEAALARLSELMFVEVIRRYIRELPDDATGWLAGLRDDGCARALALMHANPSEPWTVEALAREVHMSRSVFSERFTSCLGIPPMHYLMEWRIQVAARLLDEGAMKVTDVGIEVGYESEAAFSRAFKKLTGVAPAQWRRRHAHNGADHWTGEPSEGRLST